MTALLCCTTMGAGAIMLADSRVSYDGQAPRDICRKIIAPNNWCAVGFAGDVCFASDLVNGFGQVLAQTIWSSKTWLESDADVRTLFSCLAACHQQRGPNHAECVDKYQTQLLITWRQAHYAGTPPAGISAPTAMLSITTGGVIERKTDPGCLIIGSGAMVQPLLQIDLDGFEWSFGYAPISAFHLTLGALIRLLTRIREYQPPGVGGLFQAWHVGSAGVQPVPYMYWADVDSTHGTYVAMRIEHGRWVQEHRPTQHRIDVCSPGEIVLLSEDQRPQVFEPRLQLRTDSPGVITTPRPVLVAEEYTGGTPTPAVHAAWGSEPLPPVT